MAKGDVSKLAGFLFDYATQLESISEGYVPIELVNLFPKGYTNMMSGREFLKFARKEGLKVNVVRRECQGESGLNEHDAVYLVEGRDVKVHRSKYGTGDNFIAVHPDMPGDLLLRIQKAVSKGLARDWVGDMQGYVLKPSENCSVGTDPPKEVELYTKFIEEVDKVKDVKEFRELVKMTAKSNKKIEIPTEKWDRIHERLTESISKS